MDCRTPYAKNPFDSVTDQEIEEYKQAVTNKKGGADESLEQQHDVSFSTSEAPALEPLVAEPVVLSASGEPVRPERKAQSPTSPRSPRSDEDGKKPTFVFFFRFFSVFFFFPSGFPLFQFRSRLSSFPSIVLFRFPFILVGIFI